MPHERTSLDIWLSVAVRLRRVDTPQRSGSEIVTAHFFEQSRTKRTLVQTLSLVQYR